MNIKTKSLKSGSENSVIIIILASLLIIVLAIVGVYVAKDNQGVATFDGGKVTKAEYKIYYQMFSSYLQYYGYDQNEIPNEIAIKAATDKMILEDAKAAGVTLTDENKAEVDSIFEDESYIEYFKSYGFDIDELRKIYYNDYIIQDYIQKLADEASADDVANYIKSQADEGEEVDMNEYDTSHILFSFTKEDNTTMSDEEKATLKTEAEAVLARALNGEDFATLAQENSDDSTASNGGQYKMYMDGNTVEEYSNAVKSMKVGEVYPQLVESSYGYHIIKLNGIAENGRVNNSTERTAYANSLFTNIDETKNLSINEDLLKKFVMEIDPDAYATDEETDSTTTTDGTSDVVDVTTEESTDTSTDTTTEQ